ncbi:putative tandem protein 20, partial [Amphidinium carterae]
FSLPTAHQLCNSTQHRCAVASTGVKQCAKGSPREPLAAALWRRMAAMPCKGGKFAQAALCSAMSLVDKDQWPRFPDGSPKLLLAISWRPCWTCRCVAAHRCTDQCSIQ